jgi:hypothetical protein
MNRSAGNIEVTIEPTDGGWVSYVDPRRWPKAHFGDTKPYYAPANIADLIGPADGTIKLPLHLYWGPDRWFNLLHRSSLRDVYQMVLEEGSIADIKQYLNHDVLIAIWDDLHLPTRLSNLWESNVRELKHG